MCSCCKMTNNFANTTACNIIKQHQSIFVDCVDNVAYKILLSSGNLYVGPTARCLIDRSREHWGNVKKRTSAEHSTASSSRNKWHRHTNANYDAQSDYRRFKMPLKLFQYNRGALEWKKKTMIWLGILCYTTDNGCFFFYMLLVQCLWGEGHKCRIKIMTCYMAHKCGM